jgi:hypothetical protein
VAAAGVDADLDRGATRKAWRAWGLRSAMKRRA